MRALVMTLLLTGCAGAAPPPITPRQAPPPPPPPPPVMVEPQRPPAVVVVERPGAAPPPSPVPMEVARRVEMRSTAYCLRGSMRTGVRTRNGMAAVDPSVVPLGSVMRVSRPDGRLLGLFVAMDTGGAIRGNRIDLYMQSCSEALAWGIRQVVVEVITIGWER